MTQCVYNTVHQNEYDQVIMSKTDSIVRRYPVARYTIISTIGQNGCHAHTQFVFFFS